MISTKVNKLGEVTDLEVDLQDDSSDGEKAGKVSESRRDLILLERVARGDKDAYRQIVEKYQRRAFALAFEVLRSKEDAEDVVQEAFVKAYLSLPEFKRQSAFYTWLYRIVYNMAIDHKRKLARRGGQHLVYDETPSLAAGEGKSEEKGVIRVIESNTPGPQEQLLQREQADLIEQALSQISEDHRIAIMLREVDGLSYDEIAEATGTAKGTVMSRLFYARKKLQEFLSKE